MAKFTVWFERTFEITVEAGSFEEVNAAVKRMGQGEISALAGCTWIHDITATPTAKAELAVVDGQLAALSEAGQS